MIFTVAAWFLQWSPTPQTLERAFELAQKAVALDDALPRAHLTLGYVYLCRKQHEPAIAELERAITLDPNFADGYAHLAMMLGTAGRPEEALGLVQKAMRLNPHYPLQYSFNLGWTYILLEQYEEAVAPLKQALSRNPNYVFAHRALAACYSELGREAEARAEAEAVLRLSPNFSLEDFKQSHPLKSAAALERYVAALRKAGLK
jgi:adenylate cyclase